MGDLYMYLSGHISGLLNLSYLFTKFAACTCKSEAMRKENLLFIKHRNVLGSNIHGSDLSLDIFIWFDFMQSCHCIYYLERFVAL
jgi:hypothetical protein